MAATGMRFLGYGHPPLHRFRLGLAFALSGHREVDDMIAHHAAIARTMAEQLPLPGDVVEGASIVIELVDRISLIEPHLVSRRSAVRLAVRPRSVPIPKPLAGPAQSYPAPISAPQI